MKRVTTGDRKRDDAPVQAVFAHPASAHRASARSRRAGRRRRGGYLYVAVLFTSLIVATAIATAVSLDTHRIRIANASADRLSALRLAETELHRMTILLSQGPDFRDTWTPGVASSWTAYSVMGRDNAAARSVLDDADDDLADNPFDPVEVTAHARFGLARAAVRVDLQSGHEPLDMLRYGVTAMTHVNLESGAHLASELPVQAAGNCQSVSSGTVTTQALECSQLVGATLRGDIAASDVESVTPNLVDLYRDRGTEIATSSMATHLGAPAIWRATLSANANPYGAVDAAGSYWIDANGGEVHLVDSRIQATLAIRNASRVYVTGGLDWEPPSGQTVLLVSDSPVELESMSSTLDEAAILTNLNPDTLPYRVTDSNFSLTERYPTHLRGILYTSNDLTVRPTIDGEPVTLTGTVICNQLTLYHSLVVRSYPEPLDLVPYGLSDPNSFRFVAGSFRQVDSIED